MDGPIRPSQSWRDLCAEIRAWDAAISEETIMSEVRSISQILEDDDAMSIDEANVISAAVDGPGFGELNQWLIDIAECDGTSTEAKFAAILRGLLLARHKE